MFREKKEIVNGKKSITTNKQINKQVEYEKGRYMFVCNCVATKIKKRNIKRKKMWKTERKKKTLFGAVTRRLSISRNSTAGNLNWKRRAEVRVYRF